jgi:hypothetical protein
MKVTGTGGSKSVGGTKKSDSSKRTGGSFGDLIGGADEASETTHAAGASAIARIDVLLAAQASEDPAERAARGRMKKRGDTILRTLDRIRVGILTGNLTVGNLIDVADVVATHRERINDPELVGILDEIDLRAQIEIAKMSMALVASKRL